MRREVYTERSVSEVEASLSTRVEK